MSTAPDDRLAALESDIRTMDRRLARIERALALSPDEQAPARAPAGPSGGPTPTRPEPIEDRTRGGEDDALGRSSAPRAPSLDLEELLGGRLLAVVGGVAVLLGLGFLVALAIDRGWLDERARVVLAFLGSGALLAVGVWLHEQRGRTQASLAMVGTGIAGLYLALTAATTLYDLIPLGAAFAIAFAIGALSAGIAVAWSSQTLAGLGILGALASPVLISAVPSGKAVGFLAVVLASGTAILVFRGWDWLRVAAFAVSMPQVAAWTFDEPSLALVLAVLSGFGALNLAAALAFELRVAPSALPLSTFVLVSANALVVGLLGSDAVASEEGPRAAGLWVGGIALVHLALGAVLVRLRPASRPSALFLLVIALVSANVSFALLVEGVVQAVGWALSAPVLGTLARRYAGDQNLVRLTLAGQLTLAVAHALRFAAPPESLVYGVRDLAEAASALGAVAVAALAASRLGLGIFTGGEIALRALAGASLLYLASVGIVTAFQPGPGAPDTGIGLEVRQQGQAVLSAFWSLCGLGMLWAGLRRDARELRLAGFALLAVAVGKVFVYDLAALEAEYRVLSFVVLGLLLLAGAFAYQRMRRSSLPTAVEESEG